jgi:hypothetical protein
MGNKLYSGRTNGYMTNHYELLHQYYLNGVRKKYYSPPISDEEWTASIQ